MKINPTTRKIITRINANTNIEINNQYCLKK